MRYSRKALGGGMVLFRIFRCLHTETELQPGENFSSLLKLWRLDSANTTHIEL